MLSSNAPWQDGIEEELPDVFHALVDVIGAGVGGGGVYVILEKLLVEVLLGANSMGLRL